MSRDPGWGSADRRRAADRYDDGASDPYDDAVTERYERGVGRARDEGPRDGFVTRVLRALSGVVCGALVVLTGVVAVGHYLGNRNDYPGPGVESVTVHAVGTVVAIVAQVWSDRHRAPSALVASVLVLVIGALVMLTQWWN